MVDESKIADVYKPDISFDRALNIENGVWQLSEIDINFGRSPFRVLGTPEGKARYALATYHSKNIDEITAILKEVYPDLEKIALPKDDFYDDGVDSGYCEDSVIPDDVPLRDFILPICKFGQCLRVFET